MLTPWVTPSSIDHVDFVGSGLPYKNAALGGLFGPAAELSIDLGDTRTADTESEELSDRAQISPLTTTLSPIDSAHGNTIANAETTMPVLSQVRATTTYNVNAKPQSFDLEVALAGLYAQVRELCVARFKDTAITAELGKEIQELRTTVHASVQNVHTVDSYATNAINTTLVGEISKLCQARAEDSATIKTLHAELDALRTCVQMSSKTTIGLGIAMDALKDDVSVLKGMDLPKLKALPLQVDTLKAMVTTKVATEQLKKLEASLGRDLQAHRKATQNQLKILEHADSLAWRQFKARLEVVEKRLGQQNDAATIDQLINERVGSAFVVFGKYLKHEA